MPSTFSTNLGIELITTGEQAGTWGATTNTNLGTLIEQAISGYVAQVITDGADTVITIPSGSTGVARNMTLELTGALSAARNLIVPSNRKLYFIYNNTTGGYAVTVKVSGQTGVSVPNGAKVLLVSNGTDVVNAVNYIPALYFSAGTAAAPSISTIGDTNTGIYFPAADEVGVSTGGTERLRVNSSGNLGLGVTPSAWGSNYRALDVQVSSALYSHAAGGTSGHVSNAFFNGTNWIYKTTNNASRYEQNTIGGAHAWFTAPSGTAGNAITFTQAMTLDSSGNLGIGTSSPTQKLTVNGSGVVSSTFTVGQAGIGDSVFQVYSASYGGMRIGYNSTAVNYIDSGTLYLRNAAGSTTFATLDTSGNLGLGVTPSAWGAGINVFDVGAYSSLWYSAGFTGLSSNGYFNSGWKYKASAAASKYEQSVGEHLWYTAPSGTAGNAISFTQAMTLNSSGSLVVGSTTANRAGANTGISVEGASTSILEANINASRAGFLYADAASTIVGEFRNFPLLFRTNDTERARITSGGVFAVGRAAAVGSEMLSVNGGARLETFADIIGGAGTPELRLYQNSGNWAIQNSAGNLLFYDMDAAATRVTVDGSGNLGVGTTSPGSRLDVQSASSANSYRVANIYNSAATGTTAGSNVLLRVASNGSGADSTLVLTDSTSTNGFISNNNGNLLFGNGLGFTERMRLDSSGNLGVGQTSSSSRLTVQTSTFGDVAAANVNTAINAKTYGGTTTAARNTLINHVYTQSASAYADIQLLFANSNNSAVSSASVVYTNDGAIAFRNGGGSVAADTLTGTERARITSGGDFLVGTTTTPSSSNAGFVVAKDADGTYLRNACTITTTRTHFEFVNGNGTVGTISTNASATAYNTSSDRRLKTNIAPANDAGAVIDAIEVVQHDWKVGGHTRFGVIAQDLNAVAPEAVSVGDDGDEIEKTWGVDYSKLVPVLIKEIQSLRARVAALESN